MSSTILVSEIAQAHDGSWGLLQSLISSSLNAGADAIKLQLHYPDHESSLQEKFRVSMSSQYKNRFEYWNHVQIPKHLLVEISTTVHDSNKDLIISPFSLYALEQAIDVGVDRLKIASGEIFNKPLLHACLSTKLPLIVSTGLSTMEEIDEICEILLHHQKIPNFHTVLHCVTSYPTPPSHASLHELSRLTAKYPSLNVGLSDHSGSRFPSLYALSHGLSMIEFHVTYDRAMYGPDSQSSITFSELEFLSSYKSFLTEACTYRQAPNPEYRTLFSRSLGVSRPISAGSVLQNSDIVFKKPGSGIPPDHIDIYVGKVLSRDVNPQNLLSPEDFQ